MSMHVCMSFSIQSIENDALICVCVFSLIFISSVNLCMHENSNKKFSHFAALLSSTSI